jgi:CspA family cold shock protein
MFMKCIKQWFKRLFSSSAPRSGARLSGVIKFFDRKKRFGFIVSGEHEYFFHAAATKPKDFKALQDGVGVSFQLIEGKKGLQADHIEIVG